jgi:hypothetical protein
VREDCTRRTETRGTTFLTTTLAAELSLGQDGLAGICDDKQRLCMALALWNGHDPFLKERLFGLTNSEGNHGEDVKSTTTWTRRRPFASPDAHKYPRREYPYAARCGKRAPQPAAEQFELIDTCVFEGDQCWDVFVQYLRLPRTTSLCESRSITEGRTQRRFVLPTCGSAALIGEGEREAFARRASGRIRRRAALVARHA